MVFDLQIDQLDLMSRLPCRLSDELKADRLEAIARRKNATLAQLSIAWPMAQGSRSGALSDRTNAPSKRMRRECLARLLPPEKAHHVAARRQ